MIANVRQAERGGHHCSVLMDLGGPSSNRRDARAASRRPSGLTTTISAA
jgi:hypothetical protein